MTTDPEDGVNYTGIIGKGTEKPKLDYKKKLSSKKMKDLQEFGKPYGARDTSKLELIDEIISKVPESTIKEFLEVKLNG